MLRFQVALLVVCLFTGFLAAAQEPDQVPPPSPSGAHTASEGTAPEANVEAPRALKLITETTTMNYIAKFDLNGDVGDSVIYEDSLGRIGIGTTAPKAALDIYGGATSDVFMGMGVDPTGVTGPAMNVGYAGASLGRGAGFFNVRPDPLAIAPNPSLRFFTDNVQRVIITNTGTVGIGSAAPHPGIKLHVTDPSAVHTIAEVHNGGTGANTAAVIRTRSDVATNIFLSHGASATQSRFGNVLGGWSEVLTYTGNGLMVGTAFDKPLILGTNSAARIHVTPTGMVGIGTSSPTAKLHVAGDIIATGNITGLKVIGAVYQDLAEWVPATSDMTPGTVVVLNLDRINEVMPSSRQYDTAVAGVVSEMPGIILGIADDSKEQIATTGRVKVRADARSNPIRVGDLLVTSNTPGTAMRSDPMEINGRQFHQPGTILGKALEPLESGIGEILVLLSMQ